jgi:superoxide reductase
MKGLVCKVCGYVSLDGSKDVCPICHLKNVFEEKEEAYKMPDFKETSGESEKKHIPSFTVVKQCGLIPGAGCVDVHVKVGEILHPALPDHHIREITFYIDNKFVSNIMLKPDVNPAAVIHLKDGTKGKVQVIETCNLHGKWFNEVEIK